MEERYTMEGFTLKRPFDNIVVYAERIRQRNAQRSRALVNRRRTSTPLRVKLKSNVKSIVKVKANDDVTDSIRGDGRNALLKALKKYAQTEKIRDLENEVFNKYHRRRTAYESEI
jgi:hypothetical protein